ncbi:MAG TPA: type II toxin-antitoxin system VapC family toxin [Jatrophihabitantaceae bacterium]|jgi:PIN domain nuclease of toxin-antitoxin system
MLLLDSHVLLWALDGSPRLGRRASERIAESSGVHVSAASVWELTIKSMLGRIDAPENLAQVLDEHGFRRLDVTADHAAAIRQLPELARHDPFDRLLVAQSMCTGLDLVTADRVLLGLGRTHIVDATV